MNTKKRHSFISIWIVALQIFAGLALTVTKTHALSEEEPIFMISTYGRDGNPPSCFDTKSYPPVYARSCGYYPAVHGADARQRFRIVPHGSSATLFTIRSVFTNQCLATANGSIADGARIWQRPCNGALNQIWSLQRSSTNPSINFRLPAANKCMNTGSNGAIVLGSCGTSTSTSTPFHILPIGSGLRIKSTWSGKCLDVNSSMAYLGAKVQQWSCLGYNQTNQRWNLSLERFPETDGGQYYYTSRWYRGGFYILRPLYTHMSIQPSFPRNGNPILQADYDPMWYWQMWELFPEYDSGLSFRIKTQQQNNNYCLDQDNAGGNVNGARVQLWECNGWSNQSWRIKQLVP